MDPLITIEEALMRLEAVIQPPSREEVALFCAKGRVLAEDIYAHLDVPSYDRSMLDGFAVRTQDVKDASRDRPVVLRVMETVGAGSIPERECLPGMAIRTMTGAPIARGADTIVRLEYADEFEELGHRYTRIYKSVPLHEAIQRQGSGMQAGTKILHAGTRLGPAELSVMAAHGYVKASVTVAPKIGVLATGSEIVDLGQPLPVGKIYNSNTVLLAAMLTDLGAEVESLPIAPDDEQFLGERLRTALGQFDVLITTGGVSVGDFDLTPKVLENLGVRRLFWGIWMRPGTPVYAGIYGRQIVFALSGNPGAAQVNAQVLVAPVIKGILGHKSTGARRHARIKGAPNKNLVKHVRFLRGRLHNILGELWIDLSADQSPGFVISLEGQAALARIEPGMELSDGTLVEILML